MAKIVSFTDVCDEGLALEVGQSHLPACVSCEGQGRLRSGCAACALAAGQ